MLNRLKFRKRVRGSRLGNCPREAAYASDDDRVNSIDRDNSNDSFVEVNPRFADGHYHEFDIKRRFIEAGAKFIIGTHKVANVKIKFRDDWYINGHLDGVVYIPGLFTLLPIPEGFYIFEGKSMSTGPYWKFVKGGYRETFPSYFDQGQGYLHSEADKLTSVMSEDNPTKSLYLELPAEEEMVKVFSSLPGGLPISKAEKMLAVGKHKETGKLWYEVINKDESYWEGLKRRWLEADEGVSNNELPDRLHESPDNYECRDCRFSKECWEIEEAPAENVSVSVVDETSTDLLAAADIYAAGKTLAGLADKMVEYGKARLQLAEVGKVTVGKVKVNAYTTNRRIWNTKRLEEELTSQQVDDFSIVKGSLVQRMDADKMSLDELKGIVQMVTDGKVALLEEGKDG